MDASVLLILVQDGVTNGAIYALLGLATVLVFAVTRVIYIPQGEFVSYGAFTLAAVQAGTVPRSAWLLLAMGVAVFARDCHELLISADRDPTPVKTVATRFCVTVVGPVALLILTQFVSGSTLPLLLQVGITLAIVVPMGPWLYRLAFQPISHAPVLVLLIAAVAAHFSLMGLGLVMFGPEGARTVGFSTANISIGAVTISLQAIFLVLFSAVLVAMLFSYFSKALNGKALMATAVNPVGAQLVGISPARSGSIAFTVSAAIGVISGVLVSPLTSVYYDSGFLMGLKGFVAAVLAGLASYPVAAVGAIAVGLVEAFGSFYSSSYKEVIVFTLILPALLWRSFATHTRPTE